MGFIHPRWRSLFFLGGHQQKDIFKSSWWDDSPLLRHGHHGLSDGVRGLGKLCHVNRLEARSAFTCLERWWFYTLFFLLTFPKRGKVSILTYVFQAANKYYNELYGNHHHDHHHQETTRIYNAYTYLLVNQWHPASSREFADVAYDPRGRLVDAGYSVTVWPSWHVFLELRVTVAPNKAVATGENSPEVEFANSSIPGYIHSGKLT